MKNIMSQGDVTFIPVKDIPKGFNRIHDGILARGESSGHSHRVAILEDAELYQMDGKMFLSVGDNGVSIVHEEHAPVTLDPGNYEVHIDQSFDYSVQALRNVAD
jgi:hypothetical protein